MSASYVDAISIVGLDLAQVAAPQGCNTDARRYYGDLLADGQLNAPADRRLDHAGEQVIWNAALPGVRRFYTKTRGATGSSCWSDATDNCLNGASRTRTGDLLGAIQARWTPRSW